jgi:hypothetical protein
MGMPAATTFNCSASESIHISINVREQGLNANFCTLNFNNLPHIEKMVDTATG